MIDDDRATLLAVASGDYAGRQLLITADQAEYADLLVSVREGLLSMYEAAMRATCTELGVLAIGVALEYMAESESAFPEHQEACRLILAHNAMRDQPGEDAIFRDFGAGAYNEVLDRVADTDRELEVTLAIAYVWRKLRPDWHTPEGLEILRRVEW